MQPIMDNRYYRRAKFLISAAAPKQFPKSAGAEVAFAGRSNAGKSSALNALCDNRGLAKTSKTPGRTRLVNFFELDERRRLVDLPGYGYAKVPEAMKLEWQGLLEQYLLQQHSLRGLVVIMDIRHPLKDYDVQMLDWCQHYGLPAHVLLTKADKLSRGAQASTLQQVKRQLKLAGSPASAQCFSASNGLGMAQLVAVLDGWLDLNMVQVEA
jgi:GTP-binding protein